MTDVSSHTELRARADALRADGRTGYLSAAVAVASIVGFVFLVRAAPDLFGLVVFGATLAYLLNPLVDQLERRGVGRTAGAALVLGTLVLVIGGTAYLAAPTISAQAAQFRTRWESGELLSLLRHVEASFAERLGGVSPEDLGITAAVRDLLGGGTSTLVGYVPSILDAVSNAVIVPFVLFALLRDGPVLRRRLLSVVPNRYFEFGMNVLYKADANLGGYLRGQAFIAVLVGASTALGLGIIGVDYYLVLGFVTGVANVVPYVGFIVSAGLTLIVSIVTTGEVNQAVGVLAVFGVLQTIENVVFQPWITGKNVSMDPALVLVAILIGGRVAGVLGMALGVPAAAVLKVIAVETVTSLRRYHL